MAPELLVLVVPLALAGLLALAVVGAIKAVNRRKMAR